MFLKLLLLNGLLYNVMATALFTDEIAEIKWDDTLHYYLSKYIVPFHYNLKLKLMPDSVSGEFNASIYINCKIRIITLPIHIRNTNLPEKKSTIISMLGRAALSATFDISVEHHIKYKVLSNMPVQEYKSVDNTTMCTVFQTIPPMSTNDVAIVISDLYQVLNSTETVVNTWCRSHLIPQMTFAQYIAGNVTEYLENNFEILKKVPKLDYVAIPSLENRNRQTCGLVFYNTIVRDTIYERFGNLFNSFCRSHRILNEGFIIFFQIHIIEKVFSDSQIINSLIVQTQHEALHLNSYFAMNSFAKNISISEIYSVPFSHIIGAAIWRMLNGVLHCDSLWVSLNAYFNTRFVYSNSPPDDLWSVIQTGICHELENKMYNISIKQIMDIWTIQTHCPVVNVIRDYSDNIVKIWKEIHDRERYFVPVSYTTETNINFGNTSQSFIYLTHLNPEVEIYYGNKDKWFIANILQTGYYRVNYDNDNWMMIAYYLNSEKYENIHVINRAQIIDDAFHLMMEEKLDSAIFWELASYLWRERNYVAWYPMIKAFEHISSLFAFPTTDDEHLENIVGSLFEDINEHMYNQMRSTNDTLDKYLKQELTKWGCLINNSLCLKMTKEQFEWHLKDPKINKFLPGWNKLIFCYGSKTVNHTIWIKAFNKYKMSDYEILKFLSCSDNLQNIVYYLWFILSKLKYEMRTLKDKNIDFGALTHTKKHVYISLTNIFFSILAIHAKNSILLRDTLVSYNFKFIQDSGINTIATLIVIINNVYSKNKLDQISKFAKDNMPQLVSECIERKITTRLLEIENQRKIL
ncbi:hypothetical protein ACFW04_011106 [Cataglyphis niger]